MTDRIIGDQRERGIAWASRRFPHIQAGESWDKASALILERDGDITAVVLYNNFWPGNSVELSIAAALERPRWLTRAFLAAAFGFPFNVWGLRRITLRIASDNTKSIRFAEHLGFVREGQIREAAAEGVDMLIFGMLRHECRFLGKEFNVERQPARRTGPDSHRGGANPIQYSDR